MSRLGHHDGPDRVAITGDQAADDEPPFGDEYPAALNQLWIWDVAVVVEPRVGGVGEK